MNLTRIPSSATTSSFTYSLALSQHGPLKESSIDTIVSSSIVAYTTWSGVLRCSVSSCFFGIERAYSVYCLFGLRPILQQLRFIKLLCSNIDS